MLDEKNIERAVALQKRVHWLREHITARTVGNPCIKFESKTSNYPHDVFLSETAGKAAVAVQRREWELELEKCYRLAAQIGLRLEEPGEKP